MSAGKKPGWLREEMPNVAAIVDEFREVFGHASITDGIARAMREGTFSCEDYGTGKMYGVQRDSGAVVARIYRSPNGLIGMREGRKEWMEKNPWK